MNITLDKTTATDALLKVNLTETDYQPKVAEKIRSFARKAQIKGFRPGKVPVDLIRRMYGKSILVEEINELVSTSVNNYIREQKIHMLGEPLPNEEKARRIDWDTQRDFEFEFQIGMVEDFSIELSDKVKITRLALSADEQIADTVLDLQRRFGAVTHPELSEARDSLYGDVAATGSEERKSAFVEIEKLHKKEQKKFIGVKIGDAIAFQIEDLSDNTQALARILNVDEAEAKNARGSYTFYVSTITRTQPAELNQELFDKVFGAGAVDSADAFVAKVKQTISDNFLRETNVLLESEIQEYFVENTKINLPDNFLKLWLKSSRNQPLADEVPEKEFKEYRDALKWDLIKNKIAEDHHIDVDTEAVRARAKVLFAGQFGGMEFAEQLGDRLDVMVHNFLAGQDGKGRPFMRIYELMRNEKVMALIKEKITVLESKTSLEQYKKIAAARKR